MSLRAAAINNSHVGGFNFEASGCLFGKWSCIYHGFVDSVLRHVLIGGTFTLMCVSGFGPLCLMGFKFGNFLVVFRAEKTIAHNFVVFWGSKLEGLT